jgi:predicted TIM-barrel fold metal-dependent hydrolase
MKDGYRIFDADTHIHPASEVLERFVEPRLRERLADLQPYRVPTGSALGTTPQTHQYRFGTRYYRRILGQGAADASFTGRATHFRGSRPPSVGVLDDGAVERLRDMDEEGVDVHFLVPASWTSLVGLGDAELELGLIRAFHRFQDEYCGHDPQRLKGAIMISAADVSQSLAEIERWAEAPWAAAVIPNFSADLPLDLPDFHPLWQAAAEHDLPVVHHSVTWNPPYFPGYRDLWDNIFLGRLASHPWGAMRFVGAMVGGGIMERFPSLRVGILECGFGWLPFWARRMDEQLAYVGGTASLSRRPSEYLRDGRFFCNVEMHEGERLVSFVCDEMGDDVLGFGSDYPHDECQFPHSPDVVLGWTALSSERKRKLLWDNAQHFFHLA